MDYPYLKVFLIKIPYPSYMNEIEQFADKLEKLVHRSGKSQNVIALEIGLSVSTLSNYIHGRTIPSSKIFIRLCKSLDCTYEDLLGPIDLL